MPALEPKQIVLGLTGPFGSGCSTLASVLKENHAFTVFSLSDYVKKEWLVKNPGKKIEQATREELQAMGDYIRQEKGSDALAVMAVSEAKDTGKIETNLAFDSIRNTAEVEYFRKMLPSFYLLALDCPQNHRWSRVQVRYGGNYLQFLKDDARDKNEDNVNGQQVALCVDDADILVSNDNDDMIRTTSGWKGRLNEKIGSYIDLLNGIPRLPTEEEIYMSIAYSASLMSYCFKRQVGAVVVDQMGKVVSIGYNDNPAPLKSCIEGFYGCFRDGYIDELMKGLKFCPECGKPLKDFKFPYECPNCKQNISRIVIPDRALGRCSALHAEERAIIDSGRKNLVGCTLYVTAFPCFTCAQKILDVGINTIWYCESYPDQDGLRTFEKAGTVSLQKFEGVKARAYFRLFPRWRPQQEKNMLEKRKMI